MSNKILESLGLTTQDLIESLLSVMLFVDFGVVAKVSSDQARIDVRHAIKPRIAGQQLDETVSADVEVLWPGGGAMFSEKWTLTVGDPVLLVGLKDYVKTVASGLPGATDLNLHYSFETMKAVPCGAYKGSSTIKLMMTTGKWQLAATTIELNGNAKVFVTHGEFNTVLQVFITALNALFGTKLNGSGSAGTLTLDISAAATTTIKTGG